MTGNRFPRIFRLRRQADFVRVHEANIYGADDVLVVKATENGLNFTRIGISVSRQVGNAVVRNRWKRLIREAFRTCREQLPVGLDLVIRPRRGAGPDFHHIQQSLLRLTPRLARQAAQKT